MRLLRGSSIFVALGSFLSFGIVQAQDVTHEVQPKPTGNPGDWFAGSYPAEALKVRAEGRVAFALEVDAEGKPTHCVVSRSSGTESLDAATCAIAMEKARFEPVRQGGTAIASHFSSNVRWTLPAPPRLDPIKLPNGPQSRVGASDVTVNSDGVIEKCMPLPKPYDNVLGPPDICSLYPVGGQFSAPTIRNGHPQRRRVRITLTIEDTYIK